MSEERIDSISEYRNATGDGIDEVVAKHQMAMTSEKLFSKAEIAIELAARDVRISELEADNERLRTAIRRRGF